MTTTAEAAGIFVTQWPLRTGRPTGRHACLSVLEGNGEPDTAREAFLKAAQEAGVFVREA
ncbi:DUF982 domain-containing protein [Shinella sp.]|uniref:DUF982 domain-containing protein n=1 Tax=Shinella sp. TaxID=1870904 RepID=UPI003C741A17